MNAPANITIEVGLVFNTFEEVQVHEHLLININNCTTISTLIVYGIDPKI